MCTPLQNHAIKALLKLPYELSGPIFDNEIERLKNIEAIAYENFYFYHRLHIYDPEGKAFDAFSNACSERMQYELARAIAWVRSFDKEEIKYHGEQSEAEVPNVSYLEKVDKWIDESPPEYTELGRAVWKPKAKGVNYGHAS